jgi:hypothetical protein
VNRNLIPIGLLILVVAGVAAPSVLPLTSFGTFSYDGLDAHLFLWDFWWTKKALAGLHNPYWTDLLLYPNGASLALHSYPLPYSLVSIPVQSLWPGTAGRVVAFNGVVLMSFVLSGVGAYVLAHRITGNRQAAFVAGLMFACTPFRLLNVARLHVLSTEFLAFSVVAWIRFVESPTRGRAALLAICLSAAFYSSPEYALCAGGVAVLWVTCHWRSRPEIRSRRFVSGLAFAALTLALLTAPLTIAQTAAVVGGSVRPSRPLAEVVSWSPALVSLVTPSRVQPVYGRAFAFAGDYGTVGVEGMRSETTIAFTVWVLVYLGARRMKRDGTVFWAIAAAVFLLLTLGPALRLTGTIATKIPLPYLLLYELAPPLRSIRDPTRMLPTAMLMLSMLAAFGVRACLSQTTSRVASAGATALIVALLLFETLVPWPRKLAAGDLIPSAYDRIADAAGDFAVIDLNVDQLALLAQTRHGHPITSGATAVPRAAAGITPQLDRQTLQRLRIRYVVFPENQTPSAEVIASCGLRLVDPTGPAVYEVEGWLR